MSTCPYCGFGPLSEGTKFCSQCRTALTEETAEVGRAGGTRLSTLSPPIRTPTRKEAGKSGAAEGVRLFRPIHRTSMAIVCISDDGQDNGEEIRLRGRKLVMGRTEGDVVIGHDSAISSRHVEVYPHDEAGQPVWYVRDLGSTNGTFARVDEGLLKNGQELLLGSRRYRFQTQAAGGSGHNVAETMENQTRPWQAMSPARQEDFFATLVELAAEGDGQSFQLPATSQLVGSDSSQSDVVLPEDPFVSPKHCKIYRDEIGRWHVEATKQCVNGCWVRINAVQVTISGQFQIGEQRFTVRIP